MYFADEVNGFEVELTAWPADRSTHAQRGIVQLQADEPVGAAVSGASPFFHPSSFIAGMVAAAVVLAAHSALRAAVSSRWL